MLDRTLPIPALLACRAACAWPQSLVKLRPNPALARVLRRSLTLAAAALLLAWGGVALANPTWVWLDEQGRRVASDLPPPATVPEQRILRRPVAAATTPAVPAPANRPASALGLGAAAAGPGAAGAAAGLGAGAGPAGTLAASGAATPAATGAAARASAGAPSAPATDAALRLAVEQRNAQIRADNCQRARSALGTLQSSADQPLYVLDEQGRQVMLDAAMRRAEGARLRQIIRDNCA